MKKNTIEIILMCVVLVVLVIGLVMVIRTNYVAPEDETNYDDYLTSETVDSEKEETNNVVETTEENNPEVVETVENVETEEN